MNSTVKIGSNLLNSQKLTPKNGAMEELTGFETHRGRSQPTKSATQSKIRFLTSPKRQELPVTPQGEEDDCVMAERPLKSDLVAEEASTILNTNVVPAMAFMKRETYEDLEGEGYHISEK
jgi:hypothetical protein